MDFAIWILVLSVSGITITLWRKTSDLNNEISRIKSLLRVIETRLIELPEENVEAISRLQIQLLRLASGLPLTKEMILSGKPFMDISPEDAHTLFEKEKDEIFLLDVRTPKEYNTRRIPGARLIPLNDLKHHFKSELPNEALKIFVYCAGGDRSREACEFLSLQGYVNVYNLRGGIKQWIGPTEAEEETQLIHIEKGS